MITEKILTGRIKDLQHELTILEIEAEGNKLSLPQGIILKGRHQILSMLPTNI